MLRAAIFGTSQGMNQHRRCISLGCPHENRLLYSLVPAAVNNFILAVIQPIPYASFLVRSSDHNFHVWNLHTNRTECIAHRLFGTERISNLLSGA